MPVIAFAFNLPPEAVGSFRTLLLTALGFHARREELQGRATIPSVPQMSQSIPGKPVSLHCLDFEAEDRLTPRWHVGQPCGKASWESLVGNPRGKASDPLIHAKENVTLLLQLGRKALVHAPTRDED